MSSSDPPSPQQKRKGGKKRSRSPTTDNEMSKPNKHKTKNLQGEIVNREDTNSYLSHSQNPFKIDESLEESIQNEWVSIKKTPTKTNRLQVEEDKNDKSSSDLVLNPTSNSSPSDASHIHRCEVCYHEIVMSTKASEENFITYQKHILMHTSKTLFGELPYLDKYYCPIRTNSNDKSESPLKRVDEKKQDKCHSVFDDRDSFILHLSYNHDEFYLRLNRRLRETGESGVDGEGKAFSEEYNQLKAIKRGLQNKAHQERLLFKLPVNSLVQYISTEKDVLDAYERKHMVESPEQFLHCNTCNNVFKSVENSLLHLYFEHVYIFSKDLKFITAEDDEVELSNGIDMLSWKNDGHRSTRVSFSCPFGSCRFGKFYITQKCYCTRIYILEDKKCSV